MTFRRPLRGVVLFLAVGAILVIFSERLFWSVWRPGDEWAGVAGAWLLYSALGYGLLAVCSAFQVRNLASLFLAGACFGWLDEGVVAMTLFGDPSLPFPLTISWTGLGWHALITVLVGFYALRRVLQSARIWPAIGLSIGIGLFWGLWSVGWLAEDPPVAATPLGFFIQTSIITAILAVAEMVLAPAGLAEFRPSSAGIVVAGVLVAGWLGVITIPMVPYAPLVLAPLFGLLVLGLLRNRGQAEVTILAILGAPIRTANLLALPMLPVAALAAYLGLARFAQGIPVHLSIALAATAAGFIGLFVAFSTIMLGRPRHLATPAGDLR